MMPQDREAPLSLLLCPLAAAWSPPSVPHPGVLTPILKGVEVTTPQDR